MMGYLVYIRLSVLNKKQVKIPEHIFLLLICDRIISKMEIYIISAFILKTKSEPMLRLFYVLKKSSKSIVDRIVKKRNNIYNTRSYIESILSQPNFLIKIQISMITGLILTIVYLIITIF